MFAHSVVQRLDRGLTVSRTDQAVSHGLQCSEVQAQPFEFVVLMSLQTSRLWLVHTSRACHYAFLT